MITYLLNKLPIVRRLRSEAAIAQQETLDLKARLRHADSEIAGAARDLTECEDELAGVRKKRNELHEQIRQQHEVIINQAATLDAWKLVRNHNEQLIAEQKLMLADARSREERLHTAMQALNGSLMDRNATLADLRQELADAAAQLAKHHRPVLFARAGGLEDHEIDAALLGKDKDPAVKAMLQLIDEAAVHAMSESAAQPMPSTEAVRGFGPEERTYCSGGVYALTELKRLLEDKLAPVAPEEKKAA